LQYYINIIVV